MVDIIRSLDIPPDLGYTGFMRIKINRGTQTANYSIGIYLHNWGYPIANEWEIGLYLFKWYIGVELFR